MKKLLAGAVISFYAGAVFGVMNYFAREATLEQAVAHGCLAALAVSSFLGVVGLCVWLESKEKE